MFVNKQPKENIMGNGQAAQILTNNDVQMLIKTSGKSENEIRQWYNEFYEESNRTNRMTKKQFQKFYLKLRQNPRLEQITDHIFRVFDTNNSGRRQDIFVYHSILENYFRYD